MPKSKIHIDFSILDKKRREAGLKLWEAAYRFAISESTFFHIKRGDGVSIRTMNRIAKSLEMDPRDLILKEGDDNDKS